VGISEGSEMGWFIFRRGSELAGFDIELARTLAAELRRTLDLDRDIQVRLVGPLPWEDLLDSPRRRDVDVVISSVSFSPEREREYGVRFSTPYFTTHQRILTATGGPPPDPRQWKDRVRVAVQIRTTSERLAAQLAAASKTRGGAEIEVVAEDELEGCVALLDSGDVQAVIADGPYLQTLVARGGYAVGDIAPDLTSPAEPALLARVDFAAQPPRWAGRVRVACQSGTLFTELGEQLRAKFAPAAEVSLEAGRDLGACIADLVAGRADVVLASAKDLRAHADPASGKYQLLRLDLAAMGLSDPIYMKHDSYGVVVAEDCPQLLWAVNSIIAGLHGAEPASDGQTPLSRRDALVRDAQRAFESVTGSRGGSTAPAGR
jgi:ABC-type amino acid transport substrate-binding protein